MIDKDFELRIESNLKNMKGPLTVTFDFTRKDLEDSLNNCMSEDQTGNLIRIQTLIREGWDLTSIFKQIEKENDPNRGMITIELNRIL